MSFVFLAADETPPRFLMPRSARLVRFYRHLALWVLQAWLAMFYVGAAAAKLSQPLDILSHLIQWPRKVDPVVVAAVGWMELGMALAILSPLISWSRFRSIMRVAAGVLLVEALAMGLYHGVERHWMLALINVLLAVMAVTVLIGRRPEGSA